MSGARRAALTALMKITEEGAYANLALKEALTGLSEQDAKWASAAVYTTLEHLITIDYRIGLYIKGRQKPVIRNILRLGACQAVYLNVPQSAACNESVKLTKAVGKGALSGYVNGVMRALCRDLQNELPLSEDPLERMSVELSVPAWLLKENVDRYGEANTRALFSPQEPYMTLRAQCPYTAEELKRELTSRNLPWEEGVFFPEAVRLKRGFDPSREPLFLNGSVTVQSESAMLVCRALCVAPGMRVLDTCAAPGGKTAYLAELMENRGELFAWELHPHRRELMEKTLSRLHVSIAKTEVRDASVLYSEYRDSFDAVLVDAPCSGLGVFGKPDVRYRKTPESISELSKLQLAILSCAAEYVKPGGALVYATCTVSKRENEDVVAAFLKAHGEFKPDSLSPVLSDSLKEREQNGMLQLLPYLDRTEGFFLARMVKS